MKKIAVALLVLWALGTTAVAVRAISALGEDARGVAVIEGASGIDGQLRFDLVRCGGGFPWESKQGEIALIYGHMLDFIRPNFPDMSVHYYCDSNDYAVAVAAVGLKKDQPNHYVYSGDYVILSSKANISNFYYSLVWGLIARQGEQKPSSDYPSYFLRGGIAALYYGAQAQQDGVVAFFLPRRYVSGMRKYFAKAKGVPWEDWFSGSDAGDWFKENPDASVAPWAFAHFASADKKRWRQMSAMLQDTFAGKYEVAALEARSGSLRKLEKAWRGHAKTGKKKTVLGAIGEANE